MSKSVYVTFYEKPKKVSVLILSSEKEETENVEILDVDVVHYAKLKDYPKMVLSE